LLAVDYDGGTDPVYIGFALPGTAKASAFWRIAKVSYAGGLATDVQWADGNLNFDNVWDNRAALSYS
jgi:hypothetical protein